VCAIDGAGNEPILDRFKKGVQQPAGAGFMRLSHPGGGDIIYPAIPTIESSSWYPTFSPSHITPQRKFINYNFNFLHKQAKQDLPKCLMDGVSTFISSPPLHPQVPPALHLAAFGISGQGS
jgi:hypothetical protein